MVNIGFLANHLGLRGSEIALYDYAYYNQTILKNKSFIFYDKMNDNNDELVIEKFKKEFEVVLGINFFEFDDYVLKHNIQILYSIKSGEDDGILSTIAKNIIHCVFNCSEKHGEVYSAISKSVLHYNDDIPIIPHIVSLPYHEKDMRIELNIPLDATVFGRHGGKEQFNIPFVHDVVYDIAKANPNIYFLFVNTNKFCKDLPNIIHLGTIIDVNLKRKFINTCDAMIWASTYGETFGLAIAEFSVCNKPVIATSLYGGGKEHVNILKEKGLWYYNRENLIDIINMLTTMDKKVLKERVWNAYSEYTPEKVMKIFHKVAIEPFNF